MWIYHYPVTTIIKKFFLCIEIIEKIIYNIVRKIKGIE